MSETDPLWKERATLVRRVRKGVPDSLRGYRFRVRVRVNFSCHCGMH